jgi:hypothetical protein
VVSLTVGNTIDELREGLWSAELDAAVAQSVLRLPPNVPFEPAPLPPPVTVPETQTQKVQAGITNGFERALRVTRNAHAQGFRVSASGPSTTTPDETPDPGAANRTPGD